MTKMLSEQHKGIPFLNLTNKSQMSRREQGSIPEVGSSSITVFDLPAKAIPTDNFLFMPPVQNIKQ